MPYLTVESTEFSTLINTVLPQYNLPSRRYFTVTIIPDIYDKMVSSIREKIVDIKSFSFTTDIWTCTPSNQSFISFSTHWVTPDVTHCSVVLKCKHFPGTHSGESMKNMILCMLEMWNIDHFKVHLIVRDNGTNIVKACRDSDIASASCFIHTLQLAVVNSLVTQRSISDMISV